VESIERDGWRVGLAGPAQLSARQYGPAHQYLCFCEVFGRLNDLLESLIAHCVSASIAFGVGAFANSSKTSAWQG
jgi:hypothetical protein